MTEIRMDPRIKELWIADLLSGNYEKGERVLHNKQTDTWCCLGVLCDRAIKEGVPLNVQESFHTSVEASVTKFDEEMNVLPNAVRVWAGLPEENPDVYIPGVTDRISIAEINDYGIPQADPDAEDVPVTFADIAALIKENF